MKLNEKETEELIEWLSDQDNIYIQTDHKTIMKFNVAEVVLRANMMGMMKLMLKEKDSINDLRRLRDVALVRRGKKIHSSLIKSRSEKEKREKEKEIRDKKRIALLLPTLKTGNVIKVSGTNDGTGYREVEEIFDNHIVCRKLIIKKKEGVPYFYRDTYVTRHYLNKIQKKLQESIGKVLY